MTLALVGLPQLGLSIDFVSWLKKEIFEKLKVTGRRSLGYHNHSVEGDASAFQLLTNYGYGGKAFTDIGYLDIRGRDILGSLNFDAQLDTNKFANPQDRRFSVEYDGKPYRVTVGDVYTTLLNSNRLATFSKYAKGIVAGYSKGPLQVRGFSRKREPAPERLRFRETTPQGRTTFNSARSFEAPKRSRSTASPKDSERTTSSTTSSGRSRSSTRSSRPRAQSS